jgi:hypothetical protein
MAVEVYTRAYLKFLAKGAWKTWDTVREGAVAFVLRKVLSGANPLDECSPDP